MNRRFYRQPKAMMVIRLHWIRNITLQIGSFSCCIQTTMNTNQAMTLKCRWVVRAFFTAACWMMTSHLRKFQYKIQSVSNSSIEIQLKFPTLLLIKFFCLHSGHQLISSFTFNRLTISKIGYKWFQTSFSTIITLQWQQRWFSFTRNTILVQLWIDNFYSIHFNKIFSTLYI